MKPASKMSETPVQPVDDYLEQTLAVQKGGSYIRREIEELRS
ncbi:MAG: hypothetical protein NT166_20690 [Candidatus Aminicenantes bacterium]|nr:hypothetical protein [Candidatus Aminicenantes bacterium]